MVNSFVHLPFDGGGDGDLDSLLISAKKEGKLIKYSMDMGKNIIIEMMMIFV